MANLFFSDDYSYWRWKSPCYREHLSLINHTHRFTLASRDLPRANKFDFAGDSEGALHVVAQSLLQLDQALLIAVDLSGHFHEHVELVHVVCGSVHDDLVLRFYLSCLQ